MLEPPGTIPQSHVRQFELFGMVLRSWCETLENRDRDSTQNFGANLGSIYSGFGWRAIFEKPTNTAEGLDTFPAWAGPENAA